MGQNYFIIYAQFIHLNDSIVLDVLQQWHYAEFYCL